MRFPSFQSSLHFVLAACAGFGFCALSSTALPASFNTIYTFNPSSDGSSPQSELTQGTDLRFYGTNSADGPNGTGSVFSINAAGTDFRSLSSFGPVSGGIQPIGGLVQATDGNFYGTTYGGGDNAVGTLFQVTPAGDLTRLASFNLGDPGAHPAGTLVQGIDGFLYGTAQLGGLNNYGTVFRASIPDGTLTTVSGFNGGLDGLYPESDLTQTSDGNFYGTTTSGGTGNAGTIFRVSPAGVRTVIYSFTGNQDGSEPLRGVVLGADGLLYGIARTGGVNSAGTIFQVTTSGTLTVLHSFSPAINDAYFSYGRLVQASDGNFYGTTNLGGTFNAGTLFEVTPTGGFTILYSFTNGTDGGYPKGGLVQAADGKLYGTTSGLNGQKGTIFQVDLNLPVPTPRPVLFAPAAVNPGDTITISGDYFLGATAVKFVGPNGALPATSYTVLSKTKIQAVVPAEAVTGAISVVNNTLSGSTPGLLTINTVTPPGGGGGGGGGTGGTPVVSIVAPDPVASESGDNTGRFKVRRKGGDFTKALTVVLRVRGTATRGVDYNLFNRGQMLPTVTNSVTIPANKASTVVTVQVIDDTEVEPDESVVLKIKPGADYTVGTPAKAAVIIADND